MVPAQCPGLGVALPAALEHSFDQARRLMAHLPPADALQLRMAALVLARAQRRLHVYLPQPLVDHLLALSLLP